MLRSSFTHLAAVVLLAGIASSAAAKPKAKPDRRAPPTLACERATYLGDPVCDLDDGNRSLPTPASRKIKRSEEASGFAVGDRVSVDGKTNFNENRFGAAPLEKLTPGPRKRDVNGGAQMDFRF